MITDKDIQKMFAIFATKEDLKELWQRIDDQLVDFRNETMDRIDAVYKELLAMREEQIMHTHAHMRRDEKYEDHEKRITKLEKASATP